MSERDLVLALVRLIAQPSTERRDAVRRLAPAVDFDRLLDLLAPQGLVSTLGRLLIEDSELELPDRAAQRIRGVRLRARQRGLLHHALTKRLTDDLGRHGVPVVPLKGAVLADAVYGDIGARESSDIDLLVRLADLAQAVTVAERQGWREPELLRNAGLPTLHRELFHDELPPLELHWRVHGYEESFANAAMARAQLTDAGWLRPEPEDEIAFLLLFLARDGFAGVRRQLLIPRWGLVRLKPQLEQASRLRIGIARLAHTARVLARFGLAPRHVLAGRRHGAIRVL